MLSTAKKWDVDVKSKEINLCNGDCASQDVISINDFMTHELL